MSRISVAMVYLKMIYIDASVATNLFALMYCMAVSYTMLVMILYVLLSVPAGCLQKYYSMD